jgi:hypothetical protein
MANLARASIILLAGWLALIYGAVGQWPAVLASVVLGCLWLLGREWRRDESASIGLVAATLLAVAGLSWSLPAWAMLLTVAGALIAWDLHLFEAGLARAGRIEDTAMIIRRHLERLSAITVLSLVLGGLGLGIELRLSLLAALGLGSLAVFLLARILRQS